MPRRQRLRLDLGATGIAERARFADGKFGEEARPRRRLEAKAT
jgi:hypothetical protein